MRANRRAKVFREMKVRFWGKTRFRDKVILLTCFEAVLTAAASSVKMQHPRLPCTSLGHPCLKSVRTLSLQAFLHFRHWSPQEIRNTADPEAFSKWVSCLRCHALRSSAVGCRRDVMRGGGLVRPENQPPKILRSPNS